MQQLLPTLATWLQEGKSVALATVVKVYGSAPRPLGAKMGVSSQGEMVGSVSGGCVEGAVAQEALAVLASGTPKLCAFGIGDEWAQSVGLSCGGTIEVFIEPLPKIPAAWTEQETLAYATILTGEGRGQHLAVWADGHRTGQILPPELGQAVYVAAKQALRQQRTERCQVRIAGQTEEFFVEIFAPPPHLVIVGAVHIAVSLVDFAHALGFRTTVIDPRPAFATRDRFPQADEIILRWPDDVLPEMNIHPNTFIAVLSHDDKLDIPALAAALRSQARYVGALGSQQTMNRRRQALQAQGIGGDQWQRLYNPIGLDIGASSPEEIALAIMAEVVAIKNHVSKQM
ncbi:MAG: XdhC family protein [Chloroflexi bacterium]|nr:XdhC family protein [Chloroflexota bacterium]